MQIPNSRSTLNKIYCTETRIKALKANNKKVLTVGPDFTKQTIFQKQDQPAAGNRVTDSMRLKGGPSAGDHVP